MAEPLKNIAVAVVLLFICYTCFDFEGEKSISKL